MISRWVLVARSAAFSVDSREAAANRRYSFLELTGYLRIGVKSAHNLNHTGSIGTLIRIKLTRRGETDVRHPANTIEDMKKLLLGYRDNMSVVIESDVAVSAKTVADLRALATWPDGWS
jgi:hypothetical protein